MIKKLSLLLVAVLALALVVSCGPGEEEAAPAESDVDYTDNPWTNGEDLSGTTVNIFGAFVEPGSDLFRESMDYFEEQTGITVNYTGSGDFESLISVRVEG